MAIKRVKLEDIERMRGRTIKDEVDKISDKEIAESVLSDKDAVIPTSRELREFDKPKDRTKKNEKNSKT